MGTRVFTPSTKFPNPIIFIPKFQTQTNQFQTNPTIPIPKTQTKNSNPTIPKPDWSPNR